MIISTVLLSLSCKNASESKLEYSENQTIKSQVQNKEDKITWTLELEPDRLTRSLSKDKLMISPDVLFSTDILKISDAFQKPVFPELSDFGKLRTVEFQNQLESRIDDFCSKFSENKIIELQSFFNNPYIFNYVFFVKDLKEGWKLNFEQEYPEEAEQLFTKWIFGEPFMGSQIIQLPLRFYCDYGTIDVTIYIDSNENHGFYQILIDRWGKI